jgi:hypothetical protein
MRQLRQTVAGLVAAGLAVICGGVLSGCGAPAYSFASDAHDQAYFKVPSNWHQVNQQLVIQVQDNLLAKGPAGYTGGPYTWSRAYSADPDQPAQTILDGASEPVVYASVQNLRGSLRAYLSFDEMRDLLFPVTITDRQEAVAEGEKLSGFVQLSNATLTNKYGMRGINELFEYDINGLPDTFDQTVYTNAATTKLYVLLVQCYQACFLSHEAQIAAVVQSFIVRGP